MWKPHKVAAVKGMCYSDWIIFALQSREAVLWWVALILQLWDLPKLDASEPTATARTLRHTMTQMPSLYNSLQALSSVALHQDFADKQYLQGAHSRGNLVAELVELVQACQGGSSR